MIGYEFYRTCGLLFLEFEAEFDGEAVVGVVLLVAALMVPDGGVPDGDYCNVGALHAVTQ